MSKDEKAAGLMKTIMPEGFTFDPERGARWFTRAGHTGFLGGHGQLHGGGYVRLCRDRQRDARGGCEAGGAAGRALLQDQLSSRVDDRRAAYGGH